MRIHQPRILFSHRPFNGQGVSLYLDGQYRNFRVIPERPWLRMGTSFPIGDADIPKTARIDSAAQTAGNLATLTPDLSAYNGSTITIDLRHYKDDVENEVKHAKKITLDGSGDEDLKIRGAYAYQGAEIRAGGVVRVRFLFTAASIGIAPETFKLSRTAGPTSPSDVTISYAGSGLYEIDTGALSDSSAYTFDLIAENATESVSRTLDTISFTADATGPAAANSVSVEVV